MVQSLRSITVTYYFKSATWPAILTDLSCFLVQHKCHWFKSVLMTLSWKSKISLNSSTHLDQGIQRRLRSQKVYLNQSWRVSVLACVSQMRFVTAIFRLFIYTKYIEQALMWESCDAHGTNIKWELVISLKLNLCKILCHCKIDLLFQVIRDMAPYTIPYNEQSIYDAYDTSEFLSRAEKRMALPSGR